MWWGIRYSALLSRGNQQILEADAELCQLLSQVQSVLCTMVFHIVFCLKHNCWSHYFSFGHYLNLIIITNIPSTYAILEYCKFPLMKTRLIIWHSQHHWEVHFTNQMLSLCHYFLLQKGNKPNFNGCSWYFSHWYRLIFQSLISLKLRKTRAFMLMLWNALVWDLLLRLSSWICLLPPNLCSTWSTSTGFETP